MDSLKERLMYMNISNLSELYGEAQDSNNTDSEKLVELYNHELEYRYGEGNLRSLDFAQMEYLQKTIEDVILYKV